MSRYFIQEDSESDGPSDTSFWRNANNFELLHGEEVREKLSRGRNELENKRISEKNERKLSTLATLKIDKEKRRQVIVNNTTTNNININVNNTGATVNNVNNTGATVNNVNNNGTTINNNLMLQPWNQMSQSWMQFENGTSVPGLCTQNTLNAPGVFDSSFMPPSLFLNPNPVCFGQSQMKSQINTHHDPSLMFTQHGLIQDQSDINILIGRYKRTCYGDQNRQWLNNYIRALKMYHSGNHFSHGYNSIDDYLMNWISAQKRNKSSLDSIKQQLLDKIGV